VVPTSAGLSFTRSGDGVVCRDGLPMPGLVWKGLVSRAVRGDSGQGRPGNKYARLFAEPHRAGHEEDESGVRCARGGNRSGDQSEEDEERPGSAQSTIAP
jgi:hypothetical protein